MRIAPLIGAAALAVATLASSGASAQYGGGYGGYAPPPVYQPAPRYAAPQHYAPVYRNCYVQRYRVHTPYGYQWRNRRVCH